MGVKDQLQQLTKSKPALAGVAAAAALGGYALMRKNRDGGTEDAVPTAEATQAGGAARFDSTGTDIASAIGELGGGLQLQLASLQGDINEALAQFPTAGGGVGTGGGTVDVGPGTGTGGVIGIPPGEKPGKPTPIAKPAKPPKTPIKKPAKKPVIKLPVVKKAPAKTVTVKSGNTLSSIAKKSGTSLTALKKLNPGLFDKAHKGGNLIKPGEKVKVK